MDSSARKSKSRTIPKPVKVDHLKRVIPKGDPRKPRWWRVNIGKRVTGTTKIRRFFETESLAKEFIAGMLEARKEKGKLASIFRKNSPWRQ